VSALVRLYPAAWRARYGVEFEQLLAERPPAVRDILDIVAGAVDARLSPQLGGPRRSVPLSSRAAGMAALLGGAVWVVTNLIAALAQADADYGLPLTVAVGLMLLSLPGAYLRRHVRTAALAVAASGLGFAILVSGALPWGPLLLLPLLLIFGAIGPAALALAESRAGVDGPTSRRILVLVMPWPVLGVAILTSGLAPEWLAGLIYAACVLPLGLAWIAAGARIAQGPGSGSIATGRGIA